MTRREMLLDAFGAFLECPAVHTLQALLLRAYAYRRAYENLTPEVVL